MGTCRRRGWHLRLMTGVRQQVGSTVTVARLLFRANLRARHRRTLLGYAWLAIPGVVLAITFTGLRKSALIMTGEVTLPYPLFVLSGMFLWQSFGDAINLPIQQLNQQRRFLSLVPASFQPVLIAALGEVVLNLAVRLAILFVTMLAFGLPAATSWAMVPLAGLGMVGFGFALGLIIAPFAQLFDDIAGLAAMAVTFAMLLSPVLYPIPPDSLLALNPLAGLLMNVRDWMAGLPASAGVWPVILLTLGLLVPGWLLNRLSRPHIAARAH
jgi:lipopolysaccharide transport system permease protein